MHETLLLRSINQNLSDILSECAFYPMRSMLSTYYKIQGAMENID